MQKEKRRTKGHKKSSKKYLVLFILLMLIGGTFFAEAITAKLISIEKSDKLENLPFLKTMESKLTYLKLELVLHKDQSITATSKTRNLIISPISPDVTILVHLTLDNRKNYRDLQIYGSLNEEGLVFEEVESLPEPPSCYEKFTFNRESPELRFCLPISEEKEIRSTVRYRASFKEQQDVDPFDILGQASIELPEGQYFAAIILMSDENVKFDYSISDGRCPYKNMTYEKIEKGILCSGEIIIDSPPEGKVWVLDANLKGIDGEALEEEKTSKRDKILGATFIVAFLALVLPYRVKILSFFRRKKKKKPDYIG